MWMYVKAYFVTLVLFLVFDMLWLGVVAKNIYVREIGHLMKSKPNWFAAVVFYALFIFGLLYFVILPALQTGNLTAALITGMIFGLITYATYDLTNLATLKDWPLKLSVIDMLWGMSLGGIVSVLSILLLRRI